MAAAGSGIYAGTGTCNSLTLTEGGQYLLETPLDNYRVEAYIQDDGSYVLGNRNIVNPEVTSTGEKICLVIDENEFVLFSTVTNITSTATSFVFLTAHFLKML
jgi:hypothetical protein